MARGRPNERSKGEEAEILDLAGILKQDGQHHPIQAGRQAGYPSVAQSALLHQVEHHGIGPKEQHGPPGQVPRRTLAQSCARKAARHEDESSNQFNHEVSL